MDENENGDDDGGDSLPVCLPAKKKKSYKQIESMIVVFSHQLPPIPDVIFHCLHAECRVQPKTAFRTSATNIIQSHSSEWYSGGTGLNPWPRNVLF